MSFYRSDIDGKADIAWCFLESISNPGSPRLGCYPDVTWSVRDARYWSALACNHIQGNEGTINRRKSIHTLWQDTTKQPRMVENTKNNDILFKMKLKEHDNQESGGNKKYTDQARLEKHFKIKSSVSLPDRSPSKENSFYKIFAKFLQK